eukprot:274134-Hanusia_phi.AAC.1
MVVPVVFMYLGAGCGLNVYRNGSTFGPEAMPHAEFWSEFFVLVREGMVFSKSKLEVRKTAGRARVGERVAKEERGGGGRRKKRPGGKGKGGRSDVDVGVAGAVGSPQVVLRASGWRGVRVGIRRGRRRGGGERGGREKGGKVGRGRRIDCLHSDLHIRWR